MKNYLVIYPKRNKPFSWRKNSYWDNLKKIIIQAKSKLRKGGMLLMENGFDQSYDIKQYLQENEYKDINILLDYNKIERFTLSKV